VAAGGHVAVVDRPSSLIGPRGAFGDLDLAERGEELLAVLDLATQRANGFVDPGDIRAPFTMSLAA
jgi:hypothetical protein